MRKIQPKTMFLAAGALLVLFAYSFYIQLAQRSPEALLVEHLGGHSKSLGLEIREFEKEWTYEGIDAVYLLKVQPPVATEVWAYQNGFRETGTIDGMIAIARAREHGTSTELQRILKGDLNVRTKVNKKQNSTLWILWPDRTYEAVLLLSTM